MKEIIKNIAQNIFEETVNIRRKLHQYPELSFNEKQTSELIQKELKKTGIPFYSGFADTGILAVLDAGKEGKTLALRADMDALPINETTNLSFSSKQKNVMHACGHDVHTASLLATSKILKQIQSKLKGKILFIFQPGEEKLPGGAKLMLEDGVFDKHTPDLIIAQHVLPEMEVGKAGFKSGMYMASTDEIYITIKGKGGHAAMPHQINDTVLAASQIIVALQQIASRRAEAKTPTVLSFGKIEANGATNVIPDEVKIEGTFRTMDEQWRNKAHSLIKQIGQNTAKAFDTTAVVEIKNGYPFLKNNEVETLKLKNFAQEFAGKHNVEDMNIRMTGEDFAYFSQKYPVCFYRVGTMNPVDKIKYNLHSSNFQIDEKVLNFAPSLMAYLAYLYVNR